MIQTLIEGIEEEARIGKNVRQRCILFPILFNRYIEEAIQEIKDEIQVGVKVGGKKVITLRFPDDIEFCTEK